jgi:hypothetical protein
MPPKSSPTPSGKNLPPPEAQESPKPTGSTLLPLQQRVREVSPEPKGTFLQESMKRKSDLSHQKLLTRKIAT